MKVISDKHSSIFFCHMLERCIKPWEVALNYGWIMAIENLKKNINLPALILIYFLLYVGKKSLALFIYFGKKMVQPMTKNMGSAMEMF